MRKLLHPLTILALAGFPFVLYSVRRTGYQVAHLFDVRLLGTHNIWEIVVLTSVVVVCCFLYRRKEKKTFSAATVAAVGAFLAFQMTEDYPTDYKLWIYIVAPVFAWSLAIASGLMLATLTTTEPNRRWRRTAAPPLRSTLGVNSSVPLTLNLSLPAAVAQLGVRQDSVKTLTVAVLALTLPNLAMAQSSSAPEDLDLIGGIFKRALEIERLSEMSDIERMVFRVDGYIMEINSGVDFIQWFSVTSPAEVSDLARHLEAIGAVESSRICADAIKVAFPGGVPTKRLEYHRVLDAFVLDESVRSTRSRLAELAKLQIEQNVDLTAKLASWIRRQSKAAEPWRPTEWSGAAP